MQMTLARTIASTLQAYKNCQTDTAKFDWEIEHGRRLDQMVRDLMPSGSGIDNGTKLDTSSTPERLVFTFGYHHMNDGGYYDGWTEHKAIVTASLVHGLSLRITGRDRNQIKDYLYDTFDCALSAMVDWDVQANGYRPIAQ